MVQLLLLHETHFQLKSPEWGNNSNSFGHYCSDSCKGLGSLFKYGADTTFHTLGNNYRRLNK